MSATESLSDQHHRERKARQDAELLANRAAALARLRAKQSATPEEQWARAEARHIKAERAREAHRVGRRTPRPRRKIASPVELTRQYHQAGSTSYIRDTDNLCDGARRLATMLLALAGNGTVVERGARGGVMTKGKLAAWLGRSRRTVQRYLCQLKDAGYISVDPAYCRRTGMLSGLKIKLLPKLLPWWRTKKPSKTAETLGETRVSPLQDTVIKLRLSEAESGTAPASRNRFERPPTPT